MSDYSLAVIIPNYNNSRYLRIGVESILRQTQLPDEIVIVDDCSTDDSRCVINNLLEEYGKIIRPLFLESNGGVSNARNKGLEYAQTEYVTFMDADDYYYSVDKLANEMGLILRAKEHGKDIVAYSSTVKVDNEGNTLAKKSLRSYYYMSGQCKLAMISRMKSENIPRDYCVSKKILVESGAYSFYKNFYEDLDLLMRLSERVDFEFTGDYGTAYRYTPSGLSKRSEKEHNDTVLEIVKMYYQKLNVIEKMQVNMLNIMWRVQRKLRRLFQNQR